MVSVATFRKLAMSFEGAVEAPHFELTSFRLNGKIFSTLSEKDARAMVKLTPEQQELLTASEPEIFQRIPNAWGDKGATWLHLKAADAKTVQSALQLSVGNLGTKKRKAVKR